MNKQLSITMVLNLALTFLLIGCDEPTLIATNLEKVEPADEYWNVMVPELSVSDFTRSLHFYTEILGFTILNQRQKPDFAYLSQERVQIMIEQIHDNGWHVGKLSYPSGRGVNFQMEFTDVMPIYGRLKQAKISLYEDIEESWYDTGNELTGQKEFLVQDPDGYLLRFTQFLGEKEKN